MDDRAALDQHLVIIGDLVQKIKNHKGPLNMTPYLKDQLDRLKMALELVKIANTQMFKDAGIDIEKHVREGLNSPKISERDKNLLRRSKQIEQDARRLQLAYSKALERTTDKEKKAQTTTQKKRQRRKLFKPLGGNKDWLPL